MPFRANLDGDRYYNHPHQIGKVERFLTNPDKTRIGKVKAVARAVL